MKSVLYFIAGNKASLFHLFIDNVTKLMKSVLYFIAGNKASLFHLSITGTCEVEYILPRQKRRILLQTLKIMITTCMVIMRMSK